MYFFVVFLNINFAVLCGKFQTHILQHTESCHRVCGTMWKSIVSLTQCVRAIYTSPCGKSPAHMRQHAMFHSIHHTALYYCCKTIIRYRAEKCKYLYDNMRNSMVLPVFVQYLIYLSFNVYFGAINRTTTYDVILFK